MAFLFLSVAIPKAQRTRRLLEPRSSPPCCREQHVCMLAWRSRDESGDARARGAAAAFVLRMAARPLHARPGHLGFWRPGGVARLHVPRPGREARVDLRGRLQGRPGAGAAHAGSVGGAARDLSRLRSLPHSRRHLGRCGLRAALVRHGRGDRRGLHALRRHQLDAGGLLRCRCRRDRHHRGGGLQADHQEHRQGPVAVGHLPA